MQVEISITAGPAAGQHFTFDKPDRFLFGRSIDARISLPNDPYISRRHFLLEISPPECKLTDLDSKNGTFVNGIRYGGRKPAGIDVIQAPDEIKDVQLQDGDEVVVGDTHMKVSIEGTPSESWRDENATLSHTPTPTPAKQEDAPSAENLLNKLLKEAVVKKSKQKVPDIQGYDIDRMIDRGGMGMIYKATDVKTGSVVAIKVMLPQMAADPDNIYAFQREIDLTRQLNHPNIVQLFDHGKTENTFYFVLEFVDGMNLFKFLEFQKGTISLKDAVPIMLGTLDGLAYAHHVTVTMEIAGGERKPFNGIVHRDLKPQNILLAHKGNKWIPKISDFGISKSFESAGFTNITKPGEVLGTPMYWPREQITHYKYLNPATDVFSAAAVFYELLTGMWVREGFDKLFERCKRNKRFAAISEYMNVIVGNPAIPIRQRKPEIPEPVAKVLDRALREEEVPYDENEMREALAQLRYPDAKAFRTALVEAFKEVGLLNDHEEAEPLEMPRRHAQMSPASAGSQKKEWQTGFWKATKATLEKFHYKRKKPALELPESSSDGSIFYSIMHQASRKEVALLVLDLKESSEYLREVGDTYFSNIIGTIYRRIKNHDSALELTFLKSTGDGFLAVFHELSVAFSLASTFLDIPINPDIQVRIALHWGTVKSGPDGDVLGVEVHKVFRIENVQMQDQIDSPPGISLPISNRILVTKQGLEQLATADRKKFTYAGKFILKGFDDLCELWVFSKEHSSAMK